MNLPFVEQLWNISKPCNVTALHSGHFNQVYRLRCGEAFFILRIYESDNNLLRIQREQRLLNLLHDSSLAIDVPRYLESRSGEQAVFLPERNRYAVLMPLLPGVHPDLNDARAQHQSGRALAELNLVLASLPIRVTADRNPAYYELDRFHPSVTNVRELPSGLPVARPKQERIAWLLQDVQEKAESLFACLPKQWIHGDYTNGNRLMGALGRITGIIDFEFCCYDMRAMELAVALGGGPTALWEHGDDWAIVEAFARGYLYLRPLEDLEIEQLPFLIRLRRLAMLIYFYGRYRDGLEREDYMRGIVDWMLSADHWLGEHGHELVARIKYAAET